jgi:hypothetical protein
MREKENNILEIVKNIFYTNRARSQNNDKNTSDESIFSERISFLFFMLELYKKNPEQDVWIEIIREIAFFEQYSTNIIPNNYSLFCERSYLGFLYIELFKLRQEQIYLLKAKEIVQEYLNGYSFHYSIVTKSSLYDGLSGIFLLILHLYSESPEIWLLELIEQILDKLISQAEKVGDAVYWGGICNQDLCNIGINFGNAGIAFALYQAASFFKNIPLMNFAKKSIAYENTFWSDYSNSNFTSFFHKNQITNNNTAKYFKLFSFTSGISGSLFVNTIITNNFDTSIFYKELFSQIISPSQLSPKNLQQILGIYEIAAIGQSLSTCYQLSVDDTYDIIANSLVDFCINHINNHPENEIGRDGIAIANFLLTKIDPINNSCKLLFIPILKKTADINIIPLESSFHIHSNHIIKSILKINFKNTVKIVNETFPGVLNTFMNTNNKNTDEDFIFYIKSLLSNEYCITTNSELNSIFEKEVFKFNLRKSLNNTSNITYLKNDSEILRLNALMEKDKETFLLLKLKRSPDIWIFNEEAPISIDTIFSTGDFINHFKSYGRKTFIYKIADYDKLDEYSLEIDKMILDCFITETTVQKVVVELSHFFLNQNIEILHILMNEYNVKDNSNLSEIVNSLIIDGIAYFLMEGILVESIISQESQ